MAKETVSVELSPAHPDCPFVPKTLCDGHMKANRWTMGLLLGVLSVFLGLVIYATSQSRAANVNYLNMSEKVAQVQAVMHDEVAVVRAELTTHIATQRASEKIILEKLAELKVEMAAQRKENRDLLEKILQLQIDLAKKNGHPAP